MSISEELTKELQSPVYREKMARFFELHEVGRELALLGIKHDHPEAAPEECLRLLRKRLERSRQQKWRRS